MASLDNLKRLLKEDFDKKDQDLVDKLAFVINPFLEQVANAFKKNITIDNLSREISTLTVTTTSGVPNTTTQLKTKIANRKILGINVINALNLTNPGTYPSGGVSIYWTINMQILTIQKVTGLQDDNKYQLTVELIS